MSKVKQFEDLIVPILEDLGYELVQVQMIGGKTSVLQIMIDRQDHEPVTIADCTAATRMVLDLLEVEDPIGGNYQVEVTSPGLDRPLLKKEDYERFKGSKVKIMLHEPREGQKTFKGLLLGIKDGDVFLESSGEQISIPYDSIKRSRLKVELDSMDKP
ncbi:MAG: ribosome maturation factor RimP [Alphaproteobacteria bacterium]|nr:ribosome maturation factor RimP [Alphaproteobacteria bacterium]MBT5390162.1 ribosome maturation factor RimP [Alphaproteobacteria bacterium]MBT5654181.1 ribosome maturation factor RimP [Alphaproteobacteria bacterium]